MAKKKPVGAGCNPAQTRHLLRIIESFPRRSVKLPKKPPARVALEKKIATAKAHLEALFDLHRKYSQQDNRLSADVSGRLRDRISQVRTAIYFRSREEAVKAVDGLVAEFGPLLIE